MKDGYIRCAAAVPSVKTADCKSNTDSIIRLARESAEKGCSLTVFPELCITGYTCGDLFLSDTLLKAAERELVRIAAETADLDTVIVAGLPVEHDSKLYNCAAVIKDGRVIGLVPKKNIPAYSEFYETRHFTEWKGGVTRIGSFDAFMGDILFVCRSIPLFRFGIEICEDLWVAEPPSAYLAREGALIICNPSCSDETIGKKEYRKKLCEMQSARLCAGYVYAGSGFGESTQDMVFSGHSLICENGTVLSERKPFSGEELVFTEIDLSRLSYERRRMTTFPASEEGSSAEAIAKVSFGMKEKPLALSRTYPRTPFVPGSKTDLAQRCEDIITMQAAGLATRLNAIGCKTAVIGLSGGLDSTLALIVTVHAFDMLSLDRSGIIAVTMPCFGTTSRTKNNALTLAEIYGAQIKEIGISASVRSHFADIGQDEACHDVTYENAQARERTQVLMDIANMKGGIVIGTGDLSELALGWATYNGDHMSMYGVNASVPKTLVRHLVSYEAQISDEKTAAVLRDVLDTPVSPELLPPDSSGNISQKTEDIVGPYELHDFFLYYMVRCGFSPKKLFRLCSLAYEGEYDKQVIYKWLCNFIRRFFSQQFKRSCLPDGPKVGSVTLSPRGDWRMPSDGSAAMWNAELEELKAELEI